MQDNPAVLVLVKDADDRDAVRRRLIEIDAIPLIVRRDRATAAIERYHPVAAVVDEAYAAVAPEDFLAMTSVHCVRVLTLPSSRLSEIGDAALREAVAPRTSRRRSTFGHRNWPVNAAWPSTHSGAATIRSLVTTGRLRLSDTHDVA